MTLKKVAIMIFDLGIENATIVTPEKSFAGSIYVQDGKIAAVCAPGCGLTAKETIDASGKHVFPGFIDPHVHSRDGGATYKEDFYHSTRAAALGGICTVIEMPNAVPAVSDAERFHLQKANLESKAYVDFAMWGLCLGKLNNGSLQELNRLGVAGFKFFWGYAISRANYGLVYNYREGDPSVIPPLGDGEIYTIFEEIEKTGKPLGIHAENASLIGELLRRVKPEEYRNEYEALLATRPSVCEETVVQTAISFSRATGARLHILHMSAKESVALLRKAKAEGLPVTGETCPHYLFLTNRDYDRVGTMMKGYPPVRRREDQDALWQGLLDGTIDSVGSDHAPHTAEEKTGSLFQIPSGMCGMETTVPLLLNAVNDKKLTENRLAGILSENTARLYGLYPQKGSLLPGTDADFTLVDFSREKTIRSAEMFSISKVSAFDGFQVRGLPVATIVRGRVLMADGKLTGDGSGGKFIRA